jgi:hypothetical protein
LLVTSIPGANLAQSGVSEKDRLPIALLQITNQHRSWNGSVMTFGLTAKMGFLENPIRGTVEVTDQDIIIDADLGMLEKLISRGKFKTAVEGSFQKLLQG